jgi:hypothetical protein
MYFQETEWNANSKIYLISLVDVYQMLWTGLLLTIVKHYLSSGEKFS